MNPSPMPGSLLNALSPGTRFGKYEILERLGTGGMGEVYRAKDMHLGRQVAIKVISADGHSPTNFSRFEQEARSACMLNHPNIVTIYELADVNGTHYIAMELVHGETLRKLLALGPVPFRKTIEIATQVADALAKAHEIGIVHRDLKPENLMVSEDGTAKILDFGLAKLLAVEHAENSDASTCVGPFTEPGTVLGTIGYMSPEQTTGGTMDFRSDQFSFGLVLYEMITGRPAFDGKSHAEKMAATLRDEPRRLDSKLIQAPAPFFWIVERCLAKDPKQRYSSTRDLAHDLTMVRDRLGDAGPGHEECRCSGLPVPRTALVGRERELAALRHLLTADNMRLITLTGPGGIGKTCLALQAAAESADEFPEGVCFVRLAELGEWGQVASSIAQAMGLRETSNQTPQALIAEHVGTLRSPMLLLLDNFEHLLSASPLIGQLLTLSSKLKVVVTSQAPLHIYGEHEFPVPPLALPDSKSVPSVEALSGFSAIELFVRRARAVKPEFELKKDNSTAVAAICGRLDGLPLAIELAASRIKLLSPAAMLARLESSLNLLTGGPRDLPIRQQTLRGTVEWSYRLLDRPEQAIFRKLAVFVGGCTLDAVEAVCNTKGDLGVDVLDAMASLVDKSLVQQVEQVDSEMRFIMLSTIRDYALERFAESDREAAAVRRAHAAYYLVLAEESAEEKSANSETSECFEVEHDNFRRALDYLIDSNDADWGSRLGVALFRFWETREYLSEGRDALARLLNLKGAKAYPTLYARLLFNAGVLADEQGDYTSGERWMKESLDSFIQLRDDCGIAVALNALGVNARDRGDLSAASSLFEECAVKWKNLDRRDEFAGSLSNLANIVKLQGEYARASSLYNECLNIFKGLGDECGAAWTSNYQGDLASETGDFVAALSHYEKSLTSFRQLRDGWGIGSTLCDSGNLYRDQCRFAEAERFYRESIRTFRELGRKRGVARVLECMAASAAAQCRFEDALRLAGTAAALRQRMGAPLKPIEQARLEKALEAPRRMLGSAVSLEVWMEGWAMPIEEAMQEESRSEVETSRRTVG